MNDAATAKRRILTGLKIAGASLICGFIALLLWPAPFHETASPDGRLRCYATYSDFILPYFSDGWLQVADAQTGEVTNARDIQRSLAGDSPETLAWSQDGRHFISIHARELGYSLHAFDVKTSPLRVEEVQDKRLKPWVKVLLKKQLKDGSPEEQQRARTFLNDDLHPW